MKAIFKLIFIGFTAAVIFKYLEEKGIHVKAGVESLIQLIENTDWEEVFDINEQPVEEVVIEKNKEQTFEINNLILAGTVAGEINENELYAVKGHVKNVLEVRIPLKNRERKKNYAKLDDHAFNFSDKHAKDILSLTKALTSVTKDELSKARLIYSWIASHVRYDADIYNSGSMQDQSAEAVFRRRNAVCAGFSRLFSEMAKAANIEVYVVTGFSKGYGYSNGQILYDTNHDWNVVVIKGKKHLIDVTWGAGYATVKNGRHVSVSKFDPFWFDTDPAAFIFTHFPVDEKWQLLDQKISIDEYWDMPKLSASFFRIGFDGNTILKNILSGNNITFVNAYSTDAKAIAEVAPFIRRLERKRPVKFVFVSNEAKEMRIFNNGRSVPFIKKGNRFTITVVPVNGRLSVNITNEKETSTYETLLEYDVI